ncbi:Plasma membrane sulfite pump involved in sulfite metabolism [Coemansia aciculifera]|nr:Plasma membrane sulfite pump involved in sulfite metabolism [Coemansia aciculifera]
MCGGSMWSRAWASWLGQVGGRPSEVVRWFMPFWFTVCMGTGILSACLGRVPYNVGVVWWTGVCLFILNIILLLAFIIVLLVQVVVYPEIVSYMQRHPQRMLHYGAIPMSLATVVSGAVGFGFHELSNGSVLYAAWAVWWVAVALAWAAAVLMIYLAVSRATRSIEAVTGAWLLLVAPLTVCAAAGGALAQNLPSSAAYATLLCSYTLAGAGVPLTFCVVVLYVHRVAVHKLPAHDAILTAFIPLGPVAQVGVAALTLGSVAQDVLPQMLPEVAGLGQLLFGLGIVVALMAWGSALFWAAHAVFSVVYQRRSACVPFNISWWALTFPVGVFASLTASLGDALELAFFRVCFLLLVALLLVLWTFNVVRTATGLWTGAIFDIHGLMATYDSDSSASSTSCAV